MGDTPGNEEVRTEDETFLTDSLKSIFKSWTEDKIRTQVKRMVDDGITKDVVELPGVVTARNLVDLEFTQYQAKALISFWTSPASPTTGETSSNSTVTPVLNNDENDSSRTLLGIAQFKLKWDRIYEQSYKGVTAWQVLSKGERPNRKLTSRINKEIVRQVKSSVKDVTRQSFNSVYYNMMLVQHKESFQEILGNGCECPGGFLFRLKTCFDNSIRTDRNLHLNQADLLERRFEKPRGKFTYGCVKWRVRLNPPDQTPEGIESQRLQMIKITQEVRSKNWKWDEIEIMLKNTYKAQRDFINKNVEAVLAEQKKKLANSRKRKRNNDTGEAEEEERVDEPMQQQELITITDISEEWPLLFSYKGLLIHFNVLSEIEIEKEFETFYNEQQESMINYFQSRTNTSDAFKKILSDMEKAKKKHPLQHNELRAIALLLPEYFKEEGFVDLVEETQTIETLKAPPYPKLCIPAKHKNIFKAKKFFLGVDGQFKHSFLSFEEAFKCVFMMYFVFNLEYDPKAQLCMELIQRYMLHFDPPRGNKRPQKGAKNLRFSSKVVHADVARLFLRLKAVQKPNPINGDSSSESQSGTSECSSD